MATTPRPPATKQPRRCNYFADDDIVWCKPPKLPLWPAEVIASHNGGTQFTCRLFFPPDGCPHDVKAAPAKMFFFDKLRSEAEVAECIEMRLCRKLHKVEAYEATFTKAVRRANDLVRIVLDPQRLQPFEVSGIGTVRSLMRTHISAPRQPQTQRFEPQPGVIVLRPGLENAARDLKGFDWIWVLFQFSYATMVADDKATTAVAAAAAAASAGDEASAKFEFNSNAAASHKLVTSWKTRIVPPRDTVQRGVFATRSPHRPNFIGMSCVRLVDVQGLEVHIADHDLLHGTPVIDIKPYLPFCDAHPDARAGWVTDLDERGEGGQDHRGTVALPVHRVFDKTDTEETPAAE